jgi:hypothetical protein
MPFSLAEKLGVDFTSTSTTAEHRLGEELLGSDGNTYVYVKAAEAITQYAACRLLEDGTVDMLTTTNSGAVPTTVVVPQVGISNTYYGWAVRRGVAFRVLAKTLCAADVKVYTHASAGYVDDTATDLIQGLRLNETVGGSDASASASAINGMSTNDA